jgi:hypothetical protein
MCKYYQYIKKTCTFAVDKYVNDYLIITANQRVMKK